MPLSNDNQDYKNKENKENEGKDKAGNSGEKNQQSSPESKNEFTTDNLKGKKVDADVEKETDKPADV